MALPDWRHRGDYIASRSRRRPGDIDIDVMWADEAYSDLDAVTINPDPASRSGRSARTIGYSHSAGFVVTVITVTESGVVYGVNAWRANGTDQRRYRENRA